jgi:hypothetical protein
VLNGDCLAEQLKQTSINQNFIICRECLIEGDLQARYIADFWKIRAEFITKTYNASIEEYYKITVNEFEKLTNLPENTKVCLWFENDLFCQTNMWFVLYLLKEKQNIQVFRVFPIIENKSDIWKGFGIVNTENLEQAYASKIRFQQKDIDLGYHLWNAYQKNDLNKLKELSQESSDCFDHLEEVCQAHIDRFPSDNTLGRPENMVKYILETQTKEFQEVFSAFSEREGIYGFGDLQVKSIYERLLY